jgi:hypothetical protein
MYNDNNINNLNNMVNANNAGAIGGVVKPQVTNKTGGSKTLMTLCIISIVCAVAGLLIGIFNLIRVADISQNLGSVMSTLYDSADTDTNGEELTCVEPKSASDIGYLIIGYNKGGNQMVVDADGEIGFFTNATGSADGDVLDENTVRTPTTEIMQYMISNKPDKYYNADEVKNWDYVLEVDTKDGHACYAGGYGASPVWFNYLIDLVNSKKSA